MKRAVPLPPPVDAADRLAATFCIALIVHVMLVLGVSFMPEPRAPQRPEMIDVTLVTERSAQRPKEADALAQANLEGGGNGAKEARPTAPLAAPVPARVPSLPDAEPTQGRSEESPNPAPELSAAPSPAPSVAKAAPTAKPLAPPRVVTTQPNERHALPAPTPTPTPSPPAPVATEPPAPAAPTGSENSTLPTATQLITRSFALASMSAELEDKMESRAMRPRSKYISASTQEYRYAAYMEAWRAKVERIGNINYPDEARQRGLSGALLLDVAIRPDGSVIEVVVRRSSGHKVLDDAAVRIVELAGPYAAFPPDIAKEVDVLHVTRTWRFLNSAEFTAQ